MSRDRGYAAAVDLEVGTTAVVVTVPAAEALVARVRDVFGAAAAVAVPPHVTLLYPWLDRDVCGDDDLADLERICAAVSPFDVTFDGFGRFPGVLWLAPEPAGPFAELTRAIARRWPQTPPYRGVHPDITPHLTVMDLDGAGVDAADAAAMADVERVLADGLPVRHHAAEVTLLEFVGDEVLVLRRMPLSGTPRAGA